MDRNRIWMHAGKLSGLDGNVGCVFMFQVTGT